MAAVKRRAEAALSAELPVADVGSVNRAEKGHQKGQKQGYVLAKTILK